MGVLPPAGTRRAVSDPNGHHSVKTAIVRLDKTTGVRPKRPSFGWTKRPSFGWTKRPSFGWTKRPSFGWTKRPSFGWTKRPSFGWTKQRVYGQNNGCTDKTTGVRTRHAVSLQGRRKNIGNGGLFLRPPCFCMTRRSAPTLFLLPFGFFS
jgi:hypothetical protein